jgi:hypothetical protein
MSDLKRAKAKLKENRASGADDRKHKLTKSEINATERELAECRRRNAQTTDSNN